MDKNNWMIKMYYIIEALKEKFPNSEKKQKLDLLSSEIPFQESESNGAFATYLQEFITIIRELSEEEKKQLSEEEKKQLSEEGTKDDILEFLLVLIWSWNQTNDSRFGQKKLMYKERKISIETLKEELKAISILCNIFGITLENLVDIKSFNLVNKPITIKVFKPTINGEFIKESIVRRVINKFKSKKDRRIDIEEYFYNVLFAALYLNNGENFECDFVEKEDAYLQLAKNIQQEYKKATNTDIYLKDVYEEFIKRLYAGYLNLIISLTGSEEYQEKYEKAIEAFNQMKREALQKDKKPCEIIKPDGDVKAYRKGLENSNYKYSMGDNEDPRIDDMIEYN